MTQATACAPAATRHKPCEICGTDFPCTTSRQRTCTDPDCKRALKNLSSKNWYHRQRANGWTREKTTYAHTCEWCSAAFESDNSQQTYCGLTCSNLARISREERTEREEAVVCRKRDRYDKRMSRSLLPPYRDGDYKELLHRMRAYWVEEQDSGCWNSKRLNNNGYPSLPIGRGSGIRLHRVIIEMRDGAPLGGQAAHHKCGNSKCVNPDHLQAVTQAANTAEMLARNAYIKKIEELAGELRKHDPDNGALDLRLMNMQPDE